MGFGLFNYFIAYLYLLGGNFCDGCANDGLVFVFSITYSRYFQLWSFNCIPHAGRLKNQIISIEEVKSIYFLCFWLVWSFTKQCFFFSWMSSVNGFYRLRITVCYHCLLSWYHLRTIKNSVLSNSLSIRIYFGWKCSTGISNFCANRNKLGLSLAKLSPVSCRLWVWRLPRLFWKIWLNSPRQELRFVRNFVVEFMLFHHFGWKKTFKKWVRGKYQLKIKNSELPL